MTSAASFYATRRGEVAAAVLRRAIGALWPRLDGMAVLGIGYPSPYLRLWEESAYRCVGATSAHHRGGEGLARGCTIEPTRLPFADLSFDRVLVIHGVEAGGHDERLLRELWRVLKDDGKILVVAPNRIGLWALAEGTPFGQGQPYSKGQIARLLASSMFRAERDAAALFMPPSTWRAVLAAHALFEAVGKFVAPRLAGVTITEAVKGRLCGGAGRCSRASAKRFSGSQGQRVLF